MFRRLKMGTLVAVAGGCGVALASMAMLLNRESGKFANQAAFVKTALDMVEKEPTILEMIGQPYTLGQAKVMDLWLGSDVRNVKVRVPVIGTNDRAYIYAFARKKDTKDRLKLFKIEMTFDKIEGKKMVLFDNEAKGTDSDIATTVPEIETKRNPAQNRKASPIPEGVIPERDPNSARRIPRAVLRHRKSSETNAETTTTATSDATDQGNSSGSGNDPK